MDNLLSPYDIAEDAATIEITEFQYDEKKQRRFININTILASTQNGTQTFDFNGKPTDHDNDK